MQLNNNIIIMDLYTHIIIRLPHIINMAPYTEIIKRHHTAALKTSNGLHGNIHYSELGPCRLGWVWFGAELQ